MSQSLAELPPEVLAIITSHLSGFHVLRMLHLTGSRILWGNMQRGGVTKLVLNDILNTEHDVKKIATFTGLLSLSVSWIQSQSDPFGHLIPNLPKTLTKLDLEGLMDENVWLRPETEEEALDARNTYFRTNFKTVENLSVRFPRLCHLELRDKVWGIQPQPSKLWSDGMRLLFLRMLPRSLETLHLSHLHTCPLPLHCYLPPHLTMLARPCTGEPVTTSLDPLPSSLMASLCDYTISVPLQGDIPRLPPNLTSLQVSDAWRRLFESHSPLLPSNLNSLTVTIGSISSRVSSLAEVLLLLPPTLKTLHLFVEMEVSDALQWPPQLTDLEFCTRRPLKNFNNLPKALTKFSCRTFMSAEPSQELLNSVPRHSLQSLCITNHYVTGALQIQPFCSLITLRLHVAAPHPVFINWAPCLLSLTLDFKLREESYWSVEAAQALPQSLTHLRTNYIPDYVAQHLPLSLTHLEANQVWVTGRLPGTFDEQSPPDVLKIPAALCFDPLRFRGVSSTSAYSFSSTQNLKPLPALQRQPFNVRPCLTLNAHLPLNSLVSSTVIALTTLPAHLTALEVLSIANSLCPNQFQSLCSNLRSLVCRIELPKGKDGYDLSHYTKLTSLSLILTHPFRGSEQMPPNLTHFEMRTPTAAWSLPLPPSVRHFKIGNVTNSALRSLPQLESLILFMDRVDDRFQDLPRSLTCLQLCILQSPTFLPLIDALPLLKRLHVAFIFTQTHLEGLLARKREIELPVVETVHLDRAGALLDICDVSSIGVQPLANIFHKAIANCYPFLPMVQSKSIKIEFRDEKFWRESVAPSFSQNLTILQLGPCCVPDRFTRWLPRTITDMNIIEATGTTHRSASGLPPSLTCLAMPATGFSVMSYLQLPRTITNLRLAHQRKFWPQHAKALPPSLRFLLLDILLTTNSMIAALPRTITSLEFWDSARSLSDPAFEHLPPSLTYLGGSFHNLGNVTNVFAPIPHINTANRAVITHADIKTELARKALRTSTLDDLAAHLAIPQTE